MQALASAGLGAAIVPRLAINEGDLRTAVIDLSERLAPACIGAVWLRDRELGGALAQFLDLLLQVCSVLERQQGELPALIAA